MRSKYTASTKAILTLFVIFCTQICGETICIFLESNQTLKPFPSREALARIHGSNWDDIFAGGDLSVITFGPRTIDIDGIDDRFINENTVVMRAISCRKPVPPATPWA